MNILILNWRDIKNSTAGGAELLTHEIAKRWVKKGHTVTQISAGYKGGKKRETINGVEIVRFGTWWTVHLYAAIYYLLKLRKRIDIVVDEVHWFPFFAKLYAPNKTILLACELAKDRFDHFFPKYLTIIWHLIEKIYLYIYKDTLTLAISLSTKEELIKEGLNKNKIIVLPMGLSAPKLANKYEKEKNPTLIYLGRINKHKGASDAIEVFNIVKKEITNAKLWVVGSGLPDYEKKVIKRVNEYSLKNSVTFFGFTDEIKKFKLLSKAHILIMPSIHEGWGLVVPEAGSVETPSVGYNVAGLKDVIKNGRNGLLVDTNPKSMAKKVVSLLNNKKLLDKLSNEAKKESYKYNWDNTADTALSMIEK